jgi:putative spermidine/putrescine transport system permease protein
VINRVIKKSKVSRTGMQTKLFLLTVPAVCILILFFIIPIIIVLSRSLTDPHVGLQNYITFFKESAYIGALKNTFKIAFIVTLVTLLLGYPVAYTMTIVSPRVKRLILVAVLLPFWTSLLVRTYSWMVLLQDQGFINQILLRLGIIHTPLPLIHNFIGVVIGMVYTMLPFMILPIHTTMCSIDRGLMRAGASLGAPPAVIFTRIFIPLTLPGVAAGAVMVFVMTIGYYITPSLLGGARDTMLGEFIAQQIQSFLNWGMGTAAAMVLVVATTIFFWFYLKIVGLEESK